MCFMRWEVMEEGKREFNKPKRQKNDHMKNLLQTYFQKRNYSASALENCTTHQQITYSLVENSISRPNSIFYSCYNSDPQVIEHNFAKFVTWTKDLVKNRAGCNDLELLITPLFCHLYLEILKGGHVEKAAAFLKGHLPMIERLKTDEFLKDLLLNSLATPETGESSLKEQFRSNKYSLELKPDSLGLLKKFVQDHCHVVILYVFQTWFELKQSSEKEDEVELETEQTCMDTEEQQVTEKMAHTTNGIHRGENFQKLLDAIQDLDIDTNRILSINLSNSKEPITAATLKRSRDLVCYNQHNVVTLRSIHSFNSILGHDVKEISLIEHSDRIYSMEVSPCGRFLVAGAGDGCLTIFNLELLCLVKSCEGHLGPVYSVAIGSNGAYAASGSQDLTARLWGLENGASLRVFVGHTQPITSLDFHPNCLYLATGSADKTVRLWNIDNGECLRLFHGSKGAIYALTFNPLGGTFATAGDDCKKVKIWDALTCKVVGEFKYKGEPIVRLAWSKNGGQICAGSMDGIVRVWNIEKCTENGEKGAAAEPVQILKLDAQILALEHEFDAFACVTHSP